MFFSEDPRFLDNSQIESEAFSLLRSILRVRLVILISLLIGLLLLLFCRDQFNGLEYFFIAACYFIAATRWKELKNLELLNEYFLRVAQGDLEVSKLAEKVLSQDTAHFSGSFDTIIIIFNLLNIGILFWILV